MPTEDPYRRLDYRRLIAWPSRIRREAPLLEEVLGSGPSRRILELGCGTGEHARFLASRGFDVVAIDASESMLEKAREEPLPAGLELVHGDILELDELVEGTFGGALSLGNTLPHLTGEGDMERLAVALARRLAPGAALLFQLLNYDRVFEGGVRALPVNLRPGEDPEAGDEVVFLRVMTPRDDGTVLFFPSSLRLAPEEEPPLQVVRSRRVRLRGWRWSQMEAALAAAGFEAIEAWGGFESEPWERLESQDLVLTARRRLPPGP